MNIIFIHVHGITHYRAIKNNIAIFTFTHLPTSKTGFGQMKIMNEFVWVNGFFFSKFGFRASRWKKLRQRQNGKIKIYMVCVLQTILYL
jgi:hypothetical protein